MKRVILSAMVLLSLSLSLGGCFVYEGYGRGERHERGEEGERHEHGEEHGHGGGHEDRR